MSVHKNKSGPAPGYNYVFNYLPPGLREMENSLKSGEANNGSKATEDDDPTDYISSDPLNRIIDPVAGTTKITITKA